MLIGLHLQATCLAGLSDGTIGAGPMSTSLLNAWQAHVAAYFATHELSTKNPISLASSCRL